MGRLVLGVGINDANTTYDATGSRCPFYRRWSDMLRRCYSKAYHKDKPSYVDCTVCPEWLTFSNFKSWMEKQDWEGKALDKDLLIKGNKVYSPETCLFISPEVNQFLNSGGGENGLLRGVTWREDKGKYLAQCGNKRRNAYIGLFDTEHAAHEAYNRRKFELAKSLADGQDDYRVANALIERFQVITISY